MSLLKDKSVLVTGACGSVGRELVRQLLEAPDLEPSEVIGIDNNETELFSLDQEYEADPRAKFFLGDVRDTGKMVRSCAGVHCIFHTAGFKHVVLSERSPFDAVQTNIHGVQNVITAAIENGIEKALFASTDKAVNPTSVMGTSKLMGERLFTAANSMNDGPVFTSTRFGNVLGSRGSVIPIFREQIRKGGPVTLTDRNMTRFIMSVSQSVRLVIDSIALAQGGEVFVTKMPAIRIEDLAQVMIEELAYRYGHDPMEIRIEEVGAKPGEKLYEELMSGEEVRRCVELERYFAVTPAFRSMYQDIDYSYPNVVSTTVAKAYVSSEETSMSIDDLRSFLHQHELLLNDG